MLARTVTLCFLFGCVCSNGELDRPTVKVFSIGGQECGSVPLPEVFGTKLRPDLATRLYAILKRAGKTPQHNAVYAGHQNSAGSWGPERALSRVPRIKKTSVGARSPSCRGGVRAHASRKPRRVPRVDRATRRLAIASALAASGMPALVLANGYRAFNLDYVPIVVSDEIQCLTKKSQVLEVLNALGLGDELARSRTRAAGKSRTGPLFVYADTNIVTEADPWREIRGVETMNIHEMKLMKLLHGGGKLGRLIIWTEAAFKALDTLPLPRPPIYATALDNDKESKRALFPDSLSAQPIFSERFTPGIFIIASCTIMLLGLKKFRSLRK